LSDDRSPRRRTAIGPALLAACLLAAGCGIPVSTPEALPQEGREDLLQGTTTTTTIVAEAETVEFSLFFIDPDDKLETIERPYAVGAPVNVVLADLEQPPQPEEQPSEDQEIGLLRSLVPEGLNATLLEETPADEARGVRIIQVAPEAQLRQTLDESPIQARLIVSQVVCTFLGIAPEGTVGVEIVDDQGEIQLTDNAAQLITGAATEEDFGDCKTGTEERLEQLEAAAEEAGEESTDDSTTSTEPAPTTTTAAPPTSTSTSDPDS
jgi:PAS domain-containing protein